MEERAVEPEVIEESREVALRRPFVPSSIEELASLDEERGVAVAEQRGKILHTLRAVALTLTMPSDWTLFKSAEGIITGFLGDTGCDRVKKVFGIQIDNISAMSRIDDPDTGEFAYSITGDGHSKLTGESVFAMEGVRYSTEPFAQQRPEGIQRTVAVQKAARANLDGGITRELAGLKSMPVEELTKAWEGSWKKWEMCSKGRGFGSGDERTGSGAASAHGIDPQDLPQCDLCRIPLMYRAGKGDREAFFGCRNWESHKDTKVIVPLSKAKELAQKKQQERAAAGKPQQQREPGSEG